MDNLTDISWIPCQHKRSKHASGLLTFANPLRWKGHRTLEWKVHDMGKRAYQSKCDGRTEDSLRGAIEPLLNFRLIVLR